MFAVLHYAAIATYIASAFLGLDLIIRLMQSIVYKKHTKICHLRKVCSSSVEVSFENVQGEFLFDAG